MEVERTTLSRIEELRQRLHREVQGALTQEQVTDLLAISQEIDRLSVDLIRRRWAQAESAPDRGN